MTRLHRRLIYILFIVIFLVAAPAVILYTSGYRYNIQKGRIQKTGVLMLSSIPRDAAIWLNGEKIEKKSTPERLEYILPGDYEIKFTKDGYHDWQKKLPVYENSTTFAEKVILWKLAQPEIISTNTASSWLISPDGRQTAIISSSSTLQIIEVGGDLVDLFLPNESGLKINYPLNDYSRVTILDWSADSKKILLTGNAKNNYYLIFDTTSRSLQKISGQFQTVKWSENGDRLYGQDQLGFWQIDLALGQQKLISKSFFPDDFLLADGHLYYMQNQTLWERDLIGNRDNVVTSPLSCDSCRLVKKINNRFVLQGRADQKLLIIDPGNRANDIESNAKQLYWLDNNSLLFYNDWEIYIYNLDKKDPELITRLGQPIKNVIWHPKGKHLIFSADNRINLIELDNRELRNLIDLADPAEATAMALSRDGKILYFSGTANSSSGIYKLILQ